MYSKPAIGLDGCHLILIGGVQEYFLKFIVRYLTDFEIQQIERSPISHIHIIHILRQRMLVKSPIDPRNAVRENVRSVGFIPLNDAAILSAP